MYILCLYDPTDPGLPTRSGLLLGVTKMPLLPLRWADVAVVRLLLQHRAKVGNSHGNSPHEWWVRQKLVGYHRFFLGFCIICIHIHIYIYNILYIHMKYALSFGPGEHSLYRVRNDQPFCRQAVSNV